MGMELKDTTPLGLDGGTTTERCLFCAVPLPPSFTVVNGKIVRLKKETADHDEEDCIPPPVSSSSLTTEGSTLDKQLQVIFILRNILHIQESKLDGFLKQYGGQFHPEFWCQVCLPCGEAVQQFYGILKEISGLKRRLTRISNKLKCQIHNTKEVEGGGEGSAGIWEEVRAEVLKDFALSSVGVEEKTGDLFCAQEDEETEKSSVLNTSPPPSPETRFSPYRDTDTEVEEAQDTPQSDFDPGDDNEHDSATDSESYSSEDEEYEPPKRKRALKRKANSNSSSDLPIKRKIGRPPNPMPPPLLQKPPKPKGRKPSDTAYQSLYTSFQKGRNQWYKCSLCSAEKRDRKWMVAHLRLHETGEGDNCSQCGLLIFPGNMKRHISYFHTERKPRTEDKKMYFHTCDKCPARYLEKQYLRKHLKLHDEDQNNLEDTTTCECGWLLKTKALQRHKNHHHGKGKEKQDEMKKRAEVSNAMDIPYYCDHCQMIYAYKSHLQQHHAKNHADKEGFLACSEEGCSEKLESTQLLKFHLEKDHPDVQRQEDQPDEEESQKCQHCQLEFSSKTKRDYHIAKKHKDVLLTCSACNIVHKSYKGLQKHMNTKAHAPSQTFSCELCGKSYWCDDRLKHHRRQEHFQELGLEPNACKICSKILSDKRTLSDHMRAVHSKEKNFSCECCGKLFWKQHQLVKHFNAFHEGHLGNTVVPEGRHFRLEKKEENGEETWLCDFCPKTFPNLQSVRTHLLSPIHYDQLTHVCDGCSKRFCASMGLHQHRKRCAALNKGDNEEKSDNMVTFPCSFCSKQFWNYEGLYKHQRKVHKNSYSHVCQKCGNVFKSFANLAVHEQTCCRASETVSTGSAE